jgi:hypothetical protein
VVAYGASNALGEGFDGRMEEASKMDKEEVHNFFYGQRF